MEEEKVGESDSKKYLPDEKRWRIIGYWQCCQNQGETAGFFNVSKSAVSKILGKWRSFGDIIDHERVERPQKLDQKMEEIVIDTIEQNKYSTTDDIAEELNVSRQTAFTLMKDMGLQYSVPTPIPQLNESPITKRFKFRILFSIINTD